MSNSFFRIVLFVVAVSALLMLAWGQGSALKPGQGGPAVSTTPITQTPGYFYKEIQKLKKQTNELKDKLAAAEARIASAVAKNASQDTMIEKKQNKPDYGPDYAGGGWTTKHNFLTTLDPNKTMIHFIKLK